MPAAVHHDKGISALHLCAGEGGTSAFSVARWLLANGADPNARTSELLTPVHISAAWGRSETLALLLQHGGDPRLRCDQGRTAIDYARENGNWQCVRVLKDWQGSEWDEGADQRARSPCLSDDVSVISHTVNTAKPVDRYAQFTNVSGRQCQLDPESTNGASPRSTVIDVRCCVTVRTREGSPPYGVAKEPNRSGSRPLEKEMSHAATSSGADDNDDQTLALCRRLNDAALFDRTDLSTLGPSAPGVATAPPPAPQNAADNTYSGNDTFVSALAHSVRSLDAEHSADMLNVLDDVQKLSDEELRCQLVVRGQEVGPIAKTTRAVYEKRLAELLRAESADKERPELDETWISTFKKKLPMDIRNYLCKPDRLADVLDAAECDETNVVQCFAKNDRKWREGNIRMSYNYVLIDPRLMPDYRVPGDTELIKFLHSIFYIGKGKKGRPYDHLQDCKSAELTKSAKLTRIQDIWDAGCGVILLHAFHGILPAEALTREAAMIDCLGGTISQCGPKVPGHLTNVKRGDYYGTAAALPNWRRKRLGLLWLKRFADVWKAEQGGRQIRMGDI